MTYSPIAVVCPICKAAIEDWCDPSDGGPVWDVETGDLVHQERIDLASAQCEEGL